MGFAQPLWRVKENISISLQQILNLEKVAYTINYPSHGHWLGTYYVKRSIHDSGNEKTAIDEVQSQQSNVLQVNVINTFKNLTI